MPIHVTGGMRCAGIDGWNGGSIAPTVRLWPVRMGDGDAGVGVATPIGTGGDAGPREVTQVRDRLRRDQEASHIPVGRRPAELVRCVTVRSWAVDAPAQWLSIAAAVDRYCDKKRSFEAKPWAR